MLAACMRSFALSKTPGQIVGIIRGLDVCVSERIEVSTTTVLVVTVGQTTSQLRLSLHIERLALVRSKSNL